MDANLHPRDVSPYDASDPSTVRQAQLAAKRREKEDRETLVTLLSTPNGRRWVGDFLFATHMLETSYIPGDPYAMAFREGERNVGLRLTAQINACAPEAMIRMMQERADG